MSIFFSQIKKIFKDQNKDDNFTVNNNHYIDKTFCLNTRDIESNCFLSDDDNKNFELLKDFLKIDWKYKSNITKINENQYNFQVNLSNAFKEIQKTPILKDEIKTEENWIRYWKYYLIYQKNEQGRKFSANQIEKLKDIAFEEMYIPQIKEKFFNSNKIDNYLKEYKRLFEWKSISQIKNNKKYKMFKDKNDKEGTMDCTDVKQGGLGPCCFLETISTLSILAN